MKYIRPLIPYAILLVIAVLFFYKFFFLGKIPFPGDLLLSTYKPWRSYSYLGYVPGSVPTKDQYFDAIQQMYPWRSFTTASLQSGQLPLWNPHNFSGSPLLANHQSAVLYPLNMLYLVMPQEVAWTILIVLQHVLAGLFMMLYLKRIGVSTISQLLGAIAYSYSLFFSTIDQYTTIGHTILWFPLLLWSVEKIRSEKNTILSAIISLFSVYSVLTAGHLQSAVAMLIASGVYGLLRSYDGKSHESKQRVIKIFFILSLGIGLSAVQLTPTIELVSLSARSAIDTAQINSRLLLQPYQLIQLLVPDIFGNPASRNYLINDTYATNAISTSVIALIFSIAGALVRNNAYTKISLYFVAGTALLTIRTPVSEFLYALPIPLLTSSSPSNLLFLLTFFLSVLASIGLDHWTRGEKSQKRPFIVACLCIGIVLLYIPIVKIFHIPINYKNILLSLGIIVGGAAAISMARIIPRKFLAVSFIFIACLELFYFHAKFNPFVLKEMIFPSAPVTSWLVSQQDNQRMWGYRSAGISPNTHTILGLLSPEGYDPLYPKWYGQFIYASQTGKLFNEFTTRTRSDATILPDGFDHDSIPKRNTEKILDATSVGYILDRVENGSTQDTFPPSKYESVYQQDGWNILKNKTSTPRISLVNNFTIASTNEEFENQFFTPNFLPQQTVILDKAPHQSCCSSNTNTVKQQKFANNEITVDIQTDGSAILLLTDTFYPGWKAWIDSEQTSIYRANYTFRAIVVPAGSHTIRFIYQPQSFVIGLWVSAVSLGLFVCWLFLQRSKAKI